MDTQFFLELDRPLESDTVAISSPGGATMRDRARTEDWSDDEAQQGHQQEHGRLESKDKAATNVVALGGGRGQYTRYKMKYMRNLNFNDDEPRREARRQRSVSLPVSTSPKGRGVPSSGPLAVPAAHTSTSTRLLLPFGETQPTAESVLVGGSFVPPHELVKHDSFSVWQYQQKKQVAKHAV